MHQRLGLDTATERRREKRQRLWNGRRCHHLRRIATWDRDNVEHDRELIRALVYRFNPGKGDDLRVLQSWFISTAEAASEKTMKKWFSDALMANGKGYDTLLPLYSGRLARL